MDISTLSLSDAKSILQQCRLYKDLTKKLGKRGRTLFHHSVEGTHSFIVEYYPNIDAEYVLEKAVSLYQSVFQVVAKKEDIVLVEKNHLLSGMKVYYDDNCIDLSFKSIEYKLRQS
jgi:hypothetical protein